MTSGTTPGRPRLKHSHWNTILKRPTFGLRCQGQTDNLGRRMSFSGSRGITTRGCSQHCDAVIPPGWSLMRGCQSQYTLCGTDFPVGLISPTYERAVTFRSRGDARKFRLQLATHCVAEVSVPQPRRHHSACRWEEAYSDDAALGHSVVFSRGFGLQTTLPVRKRLL